MKPRITNLKTGAAPLGPDEYRAAVERAVGRFIASVDGRQRGKMHKFLAALESLGRPATYSDVRDASGLPNTIENGWIVNSRLRHFVNIGSARLAGTEPRTHHRRGPYGSFNDVTRNVKLYEFVSYCPSKTAARAKARLDRTMDQLDGRKALGLCVVSSWSFAGSERNQRMVAERAKGRGLADIGREYGVTRERVRQVVARAINERRDSHG